jgi:hypothetical protein
MRGHERWIAAHRKAYDRWIGDQGHARAPVLPSAIPCHRRRSLHGQLVDPAAAGVQTGERQGATTS